MKKVIVIIVSIVVLVGTISIFFITKEKKTFSFCMVKTHHIYSYDGINKTHFQFFVNDIEHPLLDIDMYQGVQISNKKQKIELSPYDVVYSHSESLSNVVYQSFVLETLIPNMNQYFLIDQASITITLTTGFKVTCEIGTFEYLHLAGGGIPLFIEKLSGSKGLNSTNSRLETIAIETEELTREVINVVISKTFVTPFDIAGNDILINIPNEDFILLSCPILIEFSDSHQIINYTIFFREFELLNSNIKLVEYGYFS